MMKKYLAPALWIVAFQAIAGVIGYVTRDNMDWYDTLAKSVLTPPDIAFPIVWTILYVLLALAGWMMWSYRKTHGEAFRLYWMQMLLNWGWSFVFFAAHLVFIGFLWILALNVAMAAFMAVAWRDGLKKPALLVLPTFLWGSFAAYLNYAIWVLN